mmetsp:Transcript_142245/g.265109  ORF Transcript_142245/g.265109 Transcript_142245/m.265109 type:complete len:239 (+) Transcript_142245:248-964(+)
MTILSIVLSLPAAILVMTRFAFAVCDSAIWASFASTCFILALLSSSSLEEFISSDHTFTTPASKVLFSSIAARRSTPEMLLICPALYRIYASSASLIRVSNPCLINRSALFFKKNPFQLEKTDFISVLSWPSAMFMSICFDFFFWPTPKSSSCASIATNCCIACSASSAARKSRAKRASVLFFQLLWTLINLETCFDDSTTEDFKICWKTPESPPPSKISCIVSSSGSSHAFRTRDEL